MLGSGGGALRAPVKTEVNWPKCHCSPAASAPQSLEGAVLQAKTAAPGKLMFNTQASQKAAVLNVRQKKDPSFNLNLIKFNSLNRESHTPAHLLGVAKMCR